MQSYVVMTPPGVPAARLISELRSRDIEAMTGTNAIPFTRYYSARYGISEHDLPNTIAVARKTVTLPLYPQMSEADQDEVVQAITEIVAVVAR